MRILVIAPQPFFVERGTPIAVRLLVETLGEGGHEVDLLAYPEGQDLAHLSVIRAARVPGIRNIPIGFSWKKVVADVFLCATLVELVTTRKYDVVHAVEEAVFPAALLNTILRSRLVYDMDSSLSDQLVEKWGGLQLVKRVMEGFENWALRRSDFVFPVCERLAEKARKVLPESRVRVLEDIAFEPSETADGVDALRERFDVRGPLVMYVGNLEHYQGIDLLLEAAALVRADLCFQLVVVGGSEEAIAHYQGRADALGITARVSFAGPKPFGQLPYYLSQADVLVSPRIKGENTPMKVYSYLASGKPVLATNIGSHTQVLAEPCAVLAEPEAQAMADALTRLLEDERLRQQVGEAGGALAREKYSRQSYQSKLHDGYARLTAPSSSLQHPEQFRAAP